jgi:release factor glutamine methyltransferase
VPWDTLEAPIRVPGSRRGIGGRFRTDHRGQQSSTATGCLPTATSKGPDVTTLDSPARYPAAADDVYPPQDDSRLLIDALQNSGLASGSRVADLGTGSGVVAIAAAAMGAREVTAFDICPRAVACARANAHAAEVRIDVRLGSWTFAKDCAPFDLVLANPPYVPHSPHADVEVIPRLAGPALAWNAGPDGRLILDPLCDSATDLLSPRGTLLLVQSNFADVAQSLRRLRSSGLRADVVATQLIPFGPVLSARARWLEATGRLPVGRREEELVVIRADKP